MLVSNDKHESIFRVEHIFIFQQSSTITQKVQKHKRYVAVNCAVQSSNLAKNLFSITII